MVNLTCSLRRVVTLLAVGVISVGCGEETETRTEPMGRLDRGTVPVRLDAGRMDRGMSKPDAMVSPPQDAGQVDRGVEGPEEYIPYGQCPDMIDFTGQVQGSQATSPNGGEPQFTPFDRNYDANIEDVYARLPQRTGSDDPRPVTVEIQIDRATVVATRSRVGEGNSINMSRGRFWIADGRKTVEVFLPLTAGDVSYFDVRVGQVISFTARSIGWYGLRAQIQEASSFVLHEDGPAHPSIDRLGAVAIYEADRALEVADIPRVTRVTGILEGESMPCGGDFNCWDMEGWPNLIYRTQSDDLRAGPCISFGGPLSGFGETVQLEAFNPDWVKRYQRGAAFEEACRTGSDCASGVCISLGEEKFCSLSCESEQDCPARYGCTFDRCLPSFGGSCPEVATHTGQLQGEMAGPPNGGRLLLDSYPEAFQANIATALAQAPPASASDPVPVTTEIPIEGAVVTSTHSAEQLIGPDSDRQTPASQSRFTIADAYGSIEVYLDVGGAGATPNFQVQTGMVVSLLATQLDRYQAKRR